MLVWQRAEVQAVLRGAGHVSTPARQVGHLYVIRYANGLVKVGKATDTAERMRDHKREAARHGNPIVEHWTSPTHLFVDFAEHMLITWCERQPGAVTYSGREWFTGLSYAAAVEKADGLCASRAIKWTELPAGLIRRH